MIPVWFKIAYTAFVLYVGVIWWKNYGWKNFLWFSDIAFIGAVPAMWLESSRARERAGGRGAAARDPLERRLRGPAASCAAASPG